MSFLVKLRCLLGMHELEKFMGAKNVGGGKFSQKYKCKKCGNLKEKIS